MSSKRFRQAARRDSGAVIWLAAACLVFAMVFGPQQPGAAAAFTLAAVAALGSFALLAAREPRPLLVRRRRR